MPRGKVLLFLMLSAVGLSGCEMVRHAYHESEEHGSNAPVVSSGKPMTDFSMSPEPPAGTDPNTMGMGRMSSAPGLQPVPRFGEPTDRDLMVMTDKLSGGSVEIYSFDQPQSAGSSSSFGQPQGMRSVVEPNVTVFPLADNGPYPGQSPQALWPNAVLPGSDMTPYPAPSVTSYGGSGTARVYFKHGSSHLDGDDRKVIQSISEEAKFAPVARVSVEGHASKRAGTGDPVKDQIVNLKESMNRAYEVSKTMMLNGVPGEKIKTTAWGDTMPPAAVRNNEEAESRRVEVYTGSGY